MLKKAYLHSPFSETTIGDHNRFILLEFILAELFSSHSLCLTCEDKPLLCLQTFSPLSLSTLTQSSPLDRMQEHVSLLPLAFPCLKEEAELFIHSFSNTTNLLYNLSRRNTPSEIFSSQMISYLRQMFFLLEPFLEECKNNESFLFFLLSHHKDISLISHSRYLCSFLEKLHPGGLFTVQDQVCGHFYKNGFAYLIPEVKTLIKQVKKG